MARIPYSEAYFAEAAGRFAEEITPAQQRWEYCFDRGTHICRSIAYGDSRRPSLRTIPVVSKILGVRQSRVRLNFFRLARGSFEQAVEDSKSWKFVDTDWFEVGPMQAWHVGHLYYARVESHPHVVKIGFSRRVHERFEDIESKAKTKLFMYRGGAKPGTLADEHWWHAAWSRHNISGEWFFDPRSTDRTLPDFLASQKREAA